MDLVSFVPKILFIKDVFKKDCIYDDIITKKMMENLEIDMEDLTTNCEKIKQQYSFVEYDKLPHIFTNLDTWPEKTNLLCWYCTLNFETTPVFIPKIIEPNIIKYDNKNRNDTSETFSIGVYGVFCSFGCAYSFIKSKNYNIIDQVEDINKLNYLYKLFNKNKKQMPDYNHYPSPYEMVQYGGEYAIDDYRKKIISFI